jgi:hypothetical protein
VIVGRLPACEWLVIQQTLYVRDFLGCSVQDVEAGLEVEEVMLESRRRKFDFERCQDSLSVHVTRVKKE